MDKGSELELEFSLSDSGEQPLLLCTEFWLTRESPLGLMSETEV